MSDLSNHDDAALLARIAEADRAAFAELFARFAGRIKAFLLSGGAQMEDADELAQEVMVTIWRKAGSYDPGKSAASTWIFTIARNRRIDLIRRRKRPEPDPEDPLFHPDPDPGGLEVLATTQVQVKIRAGLEALPRDQQKVLHAAFYEGLSHGEVATKLGLPLGTVKSRIRLSFRNLRGHLGDDMLGALRDD